MASDRTVAALFVQENGVYADLPGVDCWPESRDARTYAGPRPVVAHPPCARWCRFAKLVESLGGAAHGADGGCFSAALAAVRTWGGVLEHPAWSDAWLAHGLLHPPPGGGWVNADMEGGWTCCVEQAWYGHQARKGTWLYACGVDLPSLRWGRAPDHLVTRVVSSTRRWGGALPEMSKRKRSATPPPFRDLLLSIARSARRLADVAE